MLSVKRYKSVQKSRNKTTKSDNNTQDSRSRLPNQTVQLDFLGTSAMVPSKTRKTSSILLRMGGRHWVFDTGELTQVGLQKMRVKPNKIEKNPLTWLDTMLNGVEHMNFFEGRATEYSKASTQGTWTEAFS